MSQYYNPQGFQPYTGPAQTGAAGQPFYPGAQQFPPAGAGATPTPSQAAAAASVSAGMLPIEQSYIENILRLNKGKLVSVFATFEGSTQWNSKEFKGIIEAAGRDHVILSDPQVGTRYLIPMVAVDYIQFSEEIEYQYPFAGGGPALGTYSPR